jgi:hypothetical protein
VRHVAPQKRCFFLIQTVRCSAMSGTCGSGLNRLADSGTAFSVATAREVVMMAMLRGANLRCSVAEFGPVLVRICRHDVVRSSIASTYSREKGLFIWRSASALSKGVPIRPGVSMPVLAVSEPFKTGVHFR